MKKNLIAVTCLLSLGALLGHAAPPAALNIQSPVVSENAETKIQKPEEVSTGKVKGGAFVSAATLQDAANKAVEMEADVTHLQCKSGVGYMARGSAGYSKMKNRNATLIAQREAYIRALTKAKNNLAKFLEERVVEDSQMIRENTDAIDDGNDEGSRAMSERLNVRETKNSVQSLLRGYAVYQIKEVDNEVIVHIVTSPATRSGAMALNGNMTVTSAANFDETFSRFYGELKSGILPPEGGRVIMVIDNEGKTHPFFVAFGSDIIRRAAGGNAELQRNVSEMAKANAADYAGANLCRLLQGDNFSWSGNIKNMTYSKQKSPGFDKAMKALSDDPVQNGYTGATDYDAEAGVSEFVDRVKRTDVYTSAVKGKIPAGCQQFSWTDEKGDWAFSCIVYNPNMTLEMKKNMAATFSPDGGKPDSGKSKPGNDAPVDPLKSQQGVAE